MISGFSVISAAFLYSCMLLLISLLRHSTPFLKRGGVSALLLLSGAATLRLVLPFEIPAAFTYRSWNVLGGLQIFLREHTTATRAFLAIWVIGGVIVVGWNAFDLYRARKRCRGYTVVERELVQEIARRNSIPCPVVVSPDVEVPYVAGFFHHTIYLPDLDMREDRLELVLLHEAQHIRHHDALFKLLFGVVMTAMWWNPVVYLFWGEFDTLLELRCDAGVTAGMSDKERFEYVEALKEMANLIVKGRRAPALALDESSAVGRKGNRLIQRTSVILASTGKPPRSLRPVAQCAVLLLFCASYLVVFQAAGAPPAENFQDDSRTYYYEDYDDPNAEDGIYSTFIMKGIDGRYQLFINYRLIRYLSEDEVASDTYKDLLIMEENIQ